MIRVVARWKDLPLARLLWTMCILSIWYLLTGRGRELQHVLAAIAIDRLFFGPAPSEHREKGNDANDRGRGE